MVRGKQLRDRMIRDTRASFETLSRKIDRTILPSKIEWRSEFMCLPSYGPPEPETSARSCDGCGDTKEPVMPCNVQRKIVDTSALALQDKSKEEIFRDLKMARQALELRKRVRLFLPRCLGGSTRARFSRSHLRFSPSVLKHRVRSFVQYLREKKKKNAIRNV